MSRWNFNSLTMGKRSKCNYLINPNFCHHHFSIDFVMLVTFFCKVTHILTSCCLSTFDIQSNGRKYHSVCCSWYWGGGMVLPLWYRYFPSLATFYVVITHTFPSSNSISVTFLSLMKWSNLSLPNPLSLSSPTAHFCLENILWHLITKICIFFSATSTFHHIMRCSLSLIVSHIALSWVGNASDLKIFLLVKVNILY